MIGAKASLAQVVISEQVHNLIEAGDHLERDENNWIAALWQYKQAWQTAQDIGDWMGEARSLAKIAELETWHQGEQDTIELYLKQYYELAYQMANFELLGHACELWGNYVNNNTGLKGVSGYHIQAYQHYQRLPENYSKQIRVIRKLILIYQITKQYTKRLDWHLLLLKKAQKAGKTKDVVALCGELASDYSHMGRLDSAETLLKLGEEYRSLIPRDPNALETDGIEPYLQSYYAGQQALEFAYQDRKATLITNLILVSLTFLFLFVFIRHLYRQYQNFYQTGRNA